MKHTVSRDGSKEMIHSKLDSLKRYVEDDENMQGIMGAMMSNSSLSVKGVEAAHLESQNNGTANFA